MNIKILEGEESKELKIRLYKKDQERYRKNINKEKARLIGLYLHNPKRKDIYKNIRYYQNRLRQITKIINQLLK